MTSAKNKKKREKWWSYFLQNGRCILCGEPIFLDADAHSYGGPTIEHKVPVSAGGAAWRHNRGLSHHECNRARGDRRTLQLLRPEPPDTPHERQNRRGLVPMCGIWYSHFRLPIEDGRWEQSRDTSTPEQSK